MKAFLWKGIEEVSDNYHTDGSVLIEAETLERARELARIKGWREEDKGPMVGIDAEPDLILDSPSKEEKVWVFPDAGCC